MKGAGEKPTKESKKTKILNVADAEFKARLLIVLLESEQTPYRPWASHTSVGRRWWTKDKRKKN